MGGRTNEATHECLGQKYKFSYLRVDGRTKPPISALYKSSYLWVDGRTKPLTSALVKNFKSSYLRVDERTNPLMSALVKYLPTYRVTNDPTDPPKIIDSNRKH